MRFVILLILFCVLDSAFAAAPGVGSYGELGGMMEIKPSPKVPTVKKQTECGQNQITLAAFQSAKDNEFLYENMKAFESVPGTVGTYAIEAGKVWECDDEYCQRNKLVEMPAQHVFKGEQIPSSRFYVCDLSGGDSWEPTVESVTDCTDEEKNDEHAVEETANNGNTYLIISLDVTKRPNKRICLLSRGKPTAIKPTGNDSAQEIICGDGTTRQMKDCGGIANAHKCTEKCVGGTRWEFQSLDSCVDGYRVENETCVVDIKVGDDCKSEDLSGLNATAGKYQNIGGNLKCVATECQSGAYKVKKNDVYHGYCMFDTCGNGKKLKLDNEYTDGTCEDVVVETSADEKEVAPPVENNTGTKIETDQTGAENSSKIESGQNVLTDTGRKSANTKVGSGVSAEVVGKSGAEEFVQTAQEKEQAKEQSQQKVDELKENAQKMKDKEQSTANKLLGAAGIGATGIGGMQMASAIAEQNADADAEQDMQAYLATFHCNYGGGKNVKYGETNVELPGGNELIGLYSEYVNLANDLKIRKTALDMRPGIESEPILESATSGLYDDVAVGKTSGAYASLARALLDPNGADADAWAKQKEDTASKKKTGTIVGGVGALGGAVGNLIINRDKDKEDD